MSDNLPILGVSIRLPKLKSLLTDTLDSVAVLNFIKILFLEVRQLLHKRAWKGTVR